jgi:hypothetical protein
MRSREDIIKEIESVDWTGQGPKDWTPEEMEQKNIEIAIKHMHEVAGKDDIEISN